MNIRTFVTSTALVFTCATTLAAPNIVVTARSGGPGAPEQIADGSVDRSRHNLAVDALGNTYVIGTRWNGVAWCFHTIKYAPDGSMAWDVVRPCIGNNSEYPYGIGVDATGNVYVTGTNYAEFITIKYNSAGMQQWDRRYSYPGGLYQQPRAMAVDAAGNVYVTGRSQAGGFGIDNFDYGTVKYDTSGNQQWAARYDGPDGLDDEVLDLALDGDGNVYVTGASKAAGNRNDYATVKYNAAGVQQWAARYGGGSYGDEAHAVVVNGDSVVVAGQSNSGTHYDSVTVSYDRATGVQQWTGRIAGFANSYGRAIVRDASGNVYAAGSSWIASNALMVVKYDSAGVQQWVRSWQPYAGISGTNLALSIALDPDGGVVAAGRAVGFSGLDYALVKYDAAGTQQWTQLFNGPPGTLNDEAGAVAVRGDGVVVAVGTEAYSQGNSDTDRLTTLFVADGVQDTTPQINIAPSVAGEAYAVSVSVRGKVGFPAGSVLVSDSDGQSCGIALVNGDGVCSLSNAAAGDKTVNATFSPDTPTLFAGSLNSATHMVNKAATAVTLGTSGLSHPGDAFSANVSFGVVAPGAGTPTGTITVGDGVDSCIITPPANSCLLTLTTPGARTVSANYAGDANFLAGSASVAHRVNRAPTTTNDNYSLAEDGSLAITALAGVLSNDNDADGDALSTTAATIQAAGIGGTVILQANGSFDYTPPSNANGVATFSYTAGDGAESASASVSIEVRPVNDPPSFTIGANLIHGPATTGTQTVPAFFTQISVGPADEAGQSITALSADIHSDPNDVVGAISIDSNGNLSYELTGRGGTATVSARAHDNGGTTDGGSDTSAARTFTITVASGVDLAVSADNGKRFLVGGSQVNYVVEVRNLGPDAATLASIAIAKPVNLNNFTWTCTRSNGSQCTVASGSGAVLQSIDMPLGVTETFAISATVVAVPEMPVTLNVSTVPAPGQTEMQPTSNAASDTDPVGIFANGFDG